MSAGAFTQAHPGALKKCIGGHVLFDMPQGAFNRLTQPVKQSEQPHVCGQPARGDSQSLYLVWRERCALALTEQLGNFGAVQAGNRQMDVSLKNQILTDEHERDEVIQFADDIQGAIMFWPLRVEQVHVVNAHQERARSVRPTALNLLKVVAEHWTDAAKFQLRIAFACVGDELLPSAGRAQFVQVVAQAE
jgi:hypothetical protein